MGEQPGKGYTVNFLYDTGKIQFLPVVARLNCGGELGQGAGLS